MNTPSNIVRRRVARWHRRAAAGGTASREDGNGSAQGKEEGQQEKQGSSPRPGKRQRCELNGTSEDSEPMSRKEFERKLKPLHVELVKVQLWAQHAGLRAVVIFEGRDAAGKGGAIKAITERVSPRVFRIVALPSPTDREKSQMFVQRYMAHMPAAGEIVLFDRSWYNRAGVEHVLGFCTDEQYHAFLELTPLVERSIVEQGIILIILVRGQPGATDAAVSGTT